MKLSKQERIAVLIIAVIIILGIGIFLFIVPQFEKIGTSNASLTTKKQELSDAQTRAATVTDLGTQVTDAYNQGNMLADMFFEEMTAYEADDQIRDFIQYCKDAGLKCTVDSISVGTPSVGTLGVTFNTESEVTYDLKTAAQGELDEETEEEMRTAILQEALSSSQTVGAIDVSFTVTTLEPEDMLQFIDYINDYEINGVRKAMRLSSGITIDYAEVTEKYNKVIEDMELDLNYDAIKEVADENGKDFPSKQELKEILGLAEESETTTAATNENGETTAAATTTNNTEEDDNMVTEVGDDVIYSTEVTITMYSLERMQDPTDKLAEQDELLAAY